MREGAKLIKRLFASDFKGRPVKMHNGMTLVYLGVTVDLEYKKQDNWIGVYDRRSSATVLGLGTATIREFWVCILPRLPIHIKIVAQTVSEDNTVNRVSGN